VAEVKQSFNQPCPAHAEPGGDKKGNGQQAGFVHVKEEVLAQHGHGVIGQEKHVNHAAGPKANADGNPHDQEQEQSGHEEQH
jgi:hypothetical protein